MVVIRNLDNALKIKYATLTVEDEKGHVMNIKINTDLLKITNYVREDDHHPITGGHPNPEYVGSSFWLQTTEQYVVTYSQKEQV
jgi:hypothetical protein